MKKLLLLIAFTYSSLVSSHTPLRTQASLRNHTQALEKLLIKGYGIENPFLELVTVADLIVELQEMELSEEHSTALHLFGSQMEYAIAECITAFAKDTMRSPTLKTITAIANQASEYISQHLSPQATKAQAMRSARKRQSKMFGALIGASIFSSSLKYVVVGIIGASIIGFGWSAYQSWTKPVRKTSEQTIRVQEELHAAIQEFKQSALSYQEHLSVARQPISVTEKRNFMTKVRARMKRLKEAWRNFWASSDNQRMTTASKHKIAVALRSFIKAVNDNPHAFGVRSKDRAKLKQWDHIVEKWMCENNTH